MILELFYCSLVIEQAIYEWDWGVSGRIITGSDAEVAIGSLFRLFQELFIAVLDYL